MNKQWMVLAAIASLAFPSVLMAQEAGVRDSVTVEAVQVPVPGERSSFLAGFLSAMVFPGVGSYYAGNSGHGTRHLAIGVATAAGMFAAASDCNIFAESDSSCTLALVSALAFLGNAIWSTSVAVGDAKEYNQSLRTAGLHIAPQLVAVRSGGDTQLGLQLVSFGF